MDETMRRDYDLEDIIHEFGNVPSEDAPEMSAGEEPEEFADEIADALNDEAFQHWLNNDEPEEELEEAAEETAPEPVILESHEDLQATRRIEPVQVEMPVQEVTGDTIRLEGLGHVLADPIPHTAGETDDEDVRPWNLEDTIHSEPFSEHWEPEYDQPMGEYIPPQPILFHPRSRLRELKKKLVAGPEKRFYELSELGVGKLQVAIFLSLLVALISAASTGMYALGMVQENRMRLMVFGQFLALLVSGLLSSFQMIEGVADLMKKRFTLNTLLAATFLVCCVDGILCLQQVRVPCCAAFSLMATMSLWSAYQRRNTEMSRMDTMRKAIRLDGLTACPDYIDGKKGFLRAEGQVEDFMENHAAPSKPETSLNRYSLIAAFAALLIGISAGVLQGMAAGVPVGISTGVQIAAVSLLAAVPATGFISHSRPTWILERRLHKLGTVLCGWQGVEGLCGKAVFPLTYDDLLPAGTVRLNGMKFFGSREPEQIVAYASAVMASGNSGLAGLFNQLLDSRNGRHYDACALCHYENGGIGGLVESEAVLLGTATFLKDMGIEVPDTAKVKNAVYVAIEKELSGLFALNYEKSLSASAGLTTLTSYRKLNCVFTGNDFTVTHGFLRSKFGIKPKRFVLPDYDTRDLLREKMPEEGAQSLVMTTATGLASLAYGVTGARALRTTCRWGTALHITGGVIGLLIMVLLVVLGALELLTPVNMFLYQLVWMIPALLITEWTRSV